MFLSTLGTLGAVGVSGCSFEVPDQVNPLGESIPNPSKKQGNGYSTIVSEIDNLPAKIEVTYADPAIRNVDNLLTVNLFVQEGSFLDLGGIQIHEPDIFTRIEGGKFGHILPGQFPREAEIVDDGQEARGLGVDAPWDSQKHAIFSLLFVPETDTDSISLNITLGGRAGEDGDYHEFPLDITIPLRGRDANGITPGQLAVTARGRARLAEFFGKIIASQQSFDQAATEQFREALLTTSVGGMQMLADDAFTSVLGVSEVAEYLYSTYTIHFQSPFEYLIDSEAPDDPQEIDDEVFTEYAPPFFSELLDNAQGMVDAFDNLIEYYDWDARKAEGASIILFNVIADAAREEETAWKNGDRGQARRLLANQLYMLTGEDRGADIDFIEEKFNRYDADGEESVTDYMYFRNRDTYPDASEDLIQKLYEFKTLRGDDPRYKTILSTIHAMHGVMKGEENRVGNMIEFLDEEGIPDENRASVAEVGREKTATEEETVTLDASRSTDPDEDSLTYRWEQIDGPDVTLQNPESVRTQFVAPDVDAETILEFKLTVSDGAQTDTDTITVTVTVESSQTDTVPVDGFEDGNVDDWQVVGSNYGTLSAEQDTRMAGSWVASLEADGTGGKNALYAYRDFDGKLSPGMTLESWISFTHEDSHIPKIRYVDSSDTRNYFHLRFDPPINNVWLHVGREDSGNRDNFASVGSTNTMYRVSFQLNEDSVACELMDSNGDQIAYTTVDHVPGFTYDTIDRVVIDSQDETPIDIHFDEIPYPTI